MNAIIIPVIVLGVIALVASVVLYICAKKFAVEEDPRLPLVLEALPGANCGGCGFPGCAGLASAIVKQGAVGDLSCPVGGDEVMGKIADLLGAAVANTQQAAEKPAAKSAGGSAKTATKTTTAKPKEVVIDVEAVMARLTSGPKVPTVQNIPAGTQPAVIPASWPEKINPFSPKTKEA